MTDGTTISKEIRAPIKALSHEIYFMLETSGSELFLSWPARMRSGRSAQWLPSRARSGSLTTTVNRVSGVGVLLVFSLQMRKC